MRYLEKFDVFILSILYAFVFWVLESSAHYVFFKDQYTVLSSQPFSSSSFWLEFTHPDQHELYMRLLVMILIISFGVLTQLLINRQRFFAKHDTITLAPNIRAIKPIIAQHLAGNKRLNGYLAIIRLNRLSLIQRILGVKYVNQLVVEVVERINQHLKKSFIGSSRFFNFIFFVSGDSIQSALRTLNEQLETIFNTDFVIQDIPFHVEFNIGIVSLADFETHNDVINSAYKALSKSYLNGDGTAIYDQHLDQEDKEKLLFVGEFYSAIKQNQFRLYLQPKVSLESGLIMGFEALSRWEHPQKGLIPPARYIEEAENSQAIHWLAEHNIQEGIKIMEGLHAIKKSLILSINLSSKNLINQQLFNRILNKLTASSINPNLVTFEITESAFMYHAEIAINNIKTLANNGYNISIDDFGTGYSSFTYFKDLPIDEIKIDMSFVTDIDKSKRKQSIVKNIIMLSHDINAKVCAEGIETNGELACLKELDCDLGQGYLWSKPLPSQDAFKLTIE